MPRLLDFASVVAPAHGPVHPLLQSGSLLGLAVDSAGEGTA